MVEDENEKSHVLQTAQGEVEFQNVRFGYTPEKTIIHNFSAKAKAGQKIATVGPTGAGKTTIANLVISYGNSRGISYSMKKRASCLQKLFFSLRSGCGRFFVPPSYSFF